MIFEMSLFKCVTHFNLNKEFIRNMFSANYMIADQSIPVYLHIGVYLPNYKYKYNFICILWPIVIFFPLFLSIFLSLFLSLFIHSLIGAFLLFLYVLYILFSKFMIFGVWNVRYGDLWWTRAQSRALAHTHRTRTDTKEVYGIH